MTTIRIVSFSYRKGLPEDPYGNGGGFVFDCRGLPNPYWNAKLRGFSGQDTHIRDFFAKYRETIKAFADATEALVRQTVAAYQADGRQYLMVAFGCTGGQHRSVFMAEELARRLQEIPELETVVIHTEIKNWNRR